MGVTMRDIAQQTHVSVTTVSNVLRGQGRVGQQTRAAVLNKAEELGYFRQLRAPISGLLGLLFCVPPSGSGASGTSSALPQAASHYTVEAVDGIERLVTAAGYQLLYRIVRNSHSERDLPEMVERRTVEGLFLIGGSIADEYILAVHGRGIPLVLVFTHIENANVDAVLADNQRGAYEATTHLIQLGHRRIGLLNGWDATRTSAAKFEGYRQALEAAGLDVLPERIVQGDFTFESGMAGAERLLGSATRPTALFVADDTMALGAMRLARERGLRVPDDLAIVGFGGEPLAARWEPALTTVQVPKKMIGELAARRLLEQLSSEGGLARRTVVATRLVVRESCGAGRAAVNESISGP